MLKEFQQHIQSKLPFLKDAKLLLAISGGVDSVVLAHVCHQSQLNVALAHCNFNLRGKESDADEEFVLQLAEDLDLEVFVESFDTEAYAEENKRSIQMAARELRYNWFVELGEQLEFDYVLTAHHADDNLETFLINFTRGTGLEGLTGIPEINGEFIRPLLPFSRIEIEVYAKAQKINWRDDSSNSSRKYLRNKLRHEVIPILKEINPSLLQSFQSTIENLQESQAIVEDSVNGFLEQAMDLSEETHAKFSIAEFKKKDHPKAYLFEVFKDYGFTEWNDVYNLLDAQPGKQVLSGQWRLIKDREFLLLSEIGQDDDKAVTIQTTDKHVTTPCGTLTFEAVETISETSKTSVYVDKSLLQFPLTLRRYQEGDVFYPLGMNGKKKLSKYFKDEKFSLLDKENTWLLCSGDAIIWVVGKRADNRFKVTENTKQILKIELK
ncbi:tRNA lysidine(34) synthetase TilS [Flavobacteriaceae bacterium XHP0103]|uniref:tRNA lysidine(34) synthetase TilS n=1 Tax=Marixanthotalea marina TaxID=2844359 RepID=UPI002989E333|nr:tRNA lysidine(34) synthetase TilS [Marixanthotalea marina]MBU3821672.1 tRNA lysidine(34) synthetase TilS [Marixanthotalea marina]